MVEERKSRRAKEDVDPELIALAGTGQRPSLIRPILMIAVIVLGGWIISDWRGEIEYFFSEPTPIDLGEATDYAIDASDPGRPRALPHNRYVRIRGIPTQRSQAARHRFFRLVGAPIYVEEERDDYIEDPLERELEGEAKGEIDRTYYDGAGRILAFSEVPERYRGLRQYYRSRYNVPFCDELNPGQLQELQRRKRDAIIAQWRAEYEAASPDQRAAGHMGPEPTTQQLAVITAADPACIDAWLIQDGVEPSSQWWFLAATFVFGAFMLFNVVMLGRWILRFVRS